jgi:hypothetical protein
MRVEPPRADLEKIAEHGSRADGIVKSMLEHSRGVSGERRKVDLNTLVDEALNLAYHGARAQDARRSPLGPGRAWSGKHSGFPRTLRSLKLRSTTQSASGRPGGGALANYTQLSAPYYGWRRQRLAHPHRQELGAKYALRQEIAVAVNDAAPGALVTRPAES